MNSRHSGLVLTYSLSVITIFCGGCKHDTVAPTNHNPVITSIFAFPDAVHSLDSFAVVCEAYDIDGDTVVYDWFCSPGTSIKGAEPGGWTLYNTKMNIAIFYAPDSANVRQDSIRIDVEVRDRIGGIGFSAPTFVRLSK